MLVGSPRGGGGRRSAGGFDRLRRCSAPTRWRDGSSTSAAAPAGSTRWPRRRARGSSAWTPTPRPSPSAALKQRAAAGSAYVRAEAERLPFRDGTFDVVYCFSVIEHVASVEATVAEMVRVTRRGGVIYVHTPNAWSWCEGHYKVFWAPFLPAAAGTRLSDAARPPHRLSRDAATADRRRDCAARSPGPARASATLHDDTPARESVGPLRALTGAYYRVTGIVAVHRAGGAQAVTRRDQDGPVRHASTIRPSRPAARSGANAAWASALGPPRPSRRRGDAQLRRGGARGARRRRRSIACRFR